MNDLWTVEERLRALEAQAHPTPTGKTQNKVDDRLAALEKAVKELQSHSHDSGSGDGDVASQLNHVIDELEARLPSPRRSFRLPSE